MELVNENWYIMFLYFYLEYLSMVGFDCKLIVVIVEDKVFRRRVKFWFDKRWIG